MEIGSARAPAQEEGQAVTRHGNRCGHNPRSPRYPDILRVPGMEKPHPVILTRARERIRKWYAHPAAGPFRGNDSSTYNHMRSERREAVQCLLEAVLYRLELNSRCLGTPNTGQEPYGFVDVSMDDLAALAGLGKRRCERAMRELARAGLITSKQRRGKTPAGEYYGLRAIRQVEKKLFDILGMADFFSAQSAKARERLAEKAKLRGLRSIKPFYRRVSSASGEGDLPRCATAWPDNAARLRWNLAAADIMVREPDKPPGEIRREVNARLGLPPDFHS